MRPQWDAIERRVALLQARMSEAHDLIMKLAAKRDAELNQIHIDCQKQLARAVVQSDSAGAATQAQGTYHARSEAVRKKFDDSAAATKTAADATLREVQQFGDPTPLRLSPHTNSVRRG